MSTWRHYEVVLIRSVSSAGPNGSLRVIVSAPDERTAKLTAGGQFPGYRASGAWRKS